MKRRIIFAVGVMLAVICCICGCSKKQEEAHRIIQVLEASGTVTVERTDIGEVEVYEGMRLQSGDTILVEQESWLKLQMDEDKYALVEPGSKLRLEAEGNSADSKTRIHLETGAISNRLESELSDQSVYEVSTPNSTMAVRGTVFRVEVFFDKDNVSITNVSVYDGMVESRLIYPDGTMDEEGKAVMIAGGTGVQIWGNDITSDYVSTGENIDLEPLLLKTLYFLKECYETDRDLSITEKELDDLIGILENSLEPETETETETKTTEEETTSDEPESSVEEKRPAEPESTEAVTQPAESEEKDDADSEDDADDGSNTDNSDESSEVEPSEEPESEEESEEPVIPKYTVTFMYQGNVFATQKVEKDAKAGMPKLQPTASGEWAFDFSTPITSDITIEWMDLTT